MGQNSANITINIQIPVGDKQDASYESSYNSEDSQSSSSQPNPQNMKENSSQAVCFSKKSQAKEQRN